MGTNNKILGGIIIAFIIFITARGELPAYLELLRGVKPLKTGDSYQGAVLMDVNHLDAETKSLLAHEDLLDAQNSDAVKGLTSNPLAFGIPQISANNLRF